MIAKGLLLKGGAGLATAAAGGTGIYYSVDHYLNQSTKFDQGLIDHLNAGGKIQFAVLSGSNGSTALSSFPSLSGDQTVVATVKITIDGDDANTKGKIEDKGGAADGTLGTKKYLKKLNGNGSADGTDWTWTCEIKFKKNSGDPNDLTDDYKNKVFKEDAEKGFLNKLKGNEDKDRDLKIKFIKNCAKARTKEKNRKVNGVNDLSTAVDGAISPANTLISSKDFQLRKGNAGQKEKGKSTNESDGKLYFDSEADFDTWFSA